jgi:hypothetical protein
VIVCSLPAADADFADKVFEFIRNAMLCETRLETLSTYLRTMCALPMAIESRRLATGLAVAAFCDQRPEACDAVMRVRAGAPVVSVIFE